MFAKLNKIAILAALLHTLQITGVASTCLNDDEFSIAVGGKNRSCKNIRLDEDRRQKMCSEFETVQSACPQSCGACCEDDPTYTFTRNNGEEGTCAWLTEGGEGEDQKRFELYCTNGSKTSNGRTVRDACPQSCDFCQERVELIVPITRNDDDPCEDDESYTFELLHNGKTKHCNWLTWNPKHVNQRRGRYCNIELNGQIVGSACPESCGLCTATPPPTPPNDDETPLDDGSSCVDEPGWKFWSDPVLGCDNISADPDFFCDKVGNAGLEYNGMTVYEACCVCGGGSTREI